MIGTRRLATPPRGGLSPTTPLDKGPSFRQTEVGLLVAVGIVVLGAAGSRTLAAPSTTARTLFVLIGVELGAMLLGSMVLSWRLPRADQVVFPVSCMLTGLGFVMIYRLSPTYAPRQSGGVLAGLVLMMVAALAFRDYRLLKRYKYTLVVFGFALILGTKFLGVDPYGEGYKRWFGFHGVYYQPVELLKILIVLFFAAYLDEKQEVLARAYLQVGRLRLPPLQYAGPLFSTWLLALGFLLFQNDLGSALLFFGIFLAMVYIASPRVVYSLVGLVMVAVGAVIAYHFNAHVRARVITWIDPWPYVHTDVPGTATSSWQLVQSLIGIASGGLPGEGLGQGLPTRIPVARTDFIFSAFGEELGLAGALFVLACYLVLTFRGLRIAATARDRYDKLLAAGLTSALVIQALVIIGGNIRLLPIAGVPLPFVSYGPSSLLSNFIVVGMLLRISANAHADRTRGTA